VIPEGGTVTKSLAFFKGDRFFRECGITFGEPFGGLPSVIPEGGTVTKSLAFFTTTDVMGLPSVIPEGGLSLKALPFSKAAFFL
jgi:hypothetical protein